MITDSEKEMLNNIDEQDFYAPILVLTLSRYDRLRKEAAQLNKILGPADFVAIVDEVYLDYTKYSEEEG